MVTFHGHDQVVQVGEIFVLPGQNRKAPPDGPGQHLRIAERRQTDVNGEDDATPRGREPGREPTAAHVLVNQ